MPHLRLLTIPISHYCEKVRWALDRLELPYVEEPHLQVFHYLRSYSVSRGPNVPVLIDGRTVTTDSTAILQYLERYATPENSLYPEGERRAVEDLEELFDDVLGIESRRWVYFHALQTPAMALRTSSQGVPRWQAAVAPLCYPAFAAFIRRKLAASAANVAAGLERVRGVICQVDGLLDDGRAYLVGNRFTAADLTLASLMAPFLMPPEYGVRLPRPDEVSAAMRATIEEMRATRAGQHALQLYRTLRRPGSGDLPLDRTNSAICAPPRDTPQQSSSAASHAAARER